MRWLVVACFFLNVVYADIGVTGKAELLFFKPTTDQPFYAISSSNNVAVVPDGTNIHPDGKRHLNPSTYHPGFRLETIFDLCNCETAYDLRFTYLKSKNSDSLTGDFLFDTIGYPGDGAQAPEDTSYAGTARLRETFKYVAADVTLNRYYLGDCFDDVMFLVGLHFAGIKHRDRFFAFGASRDESATKPVRNCLRRYSCFWGIGPELGLDYRYNLCCREYENVAFKAEGRAALLCSKTKASFKYVTTRTTTAGVHLRNEPLWRVTPYFDARLSLEYTFCHGCSNLSIEVGYELIWYHNCIDSIVGYDVAFAGDSIDIFNNFNLQGPYIAITKVF